MHELGQASERRIAPEEVVQQLGRRRRAEGREGQLTGMGALHPGRVVLGPEVHQEERPRAWHGVDVRRDEALAPAVDPVEVLDHEHGRLAPAARRHEPRGHGEELPLPRVGIHPWRRSRRIRHPEKVEEQGQGVLELPVEQQELAGDLLARSLITVGFGDAEVGARQLEHHEKGHRLPVCHPVRLVDGNAPYPAALEELVAEPALSDAGLAQHRYHPAVPLERAPQRRLERGGLLLPPDEAREAPPAGDLEPRPERADAAQLIDPERVPHPLQREAAEVLEVEVPCDQRRRVLGQVDLPGLGEPLHALCEAHRVALRRVVHAQIVSDRADDHLPRIEPYADREVETLGAAELAPVAPERFAEMQRRMACALRMILVRDRRAEERHDPIAGELVDGALEAVDALREDAEEAVEDAMPCLWIDLFGQIHRALHVGEQDRHLLPLAMECAAVGEDLLGQMARGVRARVRHTRRIAAERHTALGAEP